MQINRRSLLGTSLAGLAIGGLARKASADNAMPPELRAAIERQPYAPVLGNPEGDITLTEFFDYNCPVCRGVPAILQKLIAADAQLRVVLREWPVIRPESEEIARISLATLKQGKYLQFHHAMMARKGRMDRSGALEVAEGMGLDIARLERDAEGAEVTEHIHQSLDLGDHMGLAGTPTFIAGNGGAFGEQSLADLQALVKQARLDLA